MDLLRKQILPFHISPDKRLSPLFLGAAMSATRSLLPFPRCEVFSNERMLEGALIRLDRSLMYWRPNTDLILYLHWWYMLILDFPNWVWHLYWNIWRIERHGLHEIWQHRSDQMEAFCTDVMWHLKNRKLLDSIWPLPEWESLAFLRWASLTQCTILSSFMTDLGPGDTHRTCYLKSHININ